jgi:hypothetical protein
MSNQTRTEVTEQNKATLIAAMEQFGINRIQVSFDGSGDDGQIDRLTLFGNIDGSTLLDEKVEEMDDECLDSPCEVVYTHQTWKDSKWHHEKFSKQESLSDLIETVAYWPLEDHFSGWEINEGSYGTVTINADGTGSIDFNQRVIDIVSDSARF